MAKWGFEAEAREILEMMKKGESDEKILKEISGIIEGVAESVEERIGDGGEMRNEGWD